MTERWTPIYHRLFDRHHDLNGGEPFCRTMAWAWICHHAQFKNGTRIVRGEVQMLKRGEILCSLRHLSDAWGWSVKRVRNFLDYLHSCGKLGTVRGTAQGTVFRVVSYDDWRGGGTDEGTEKGAIGAQGIEGIDTPPTRAREDGPMENPSSSPPTQLEHLGVRQDAIEMIRALEGFDSLAERGLVAQYRPSGGTQERVWKGVESDRIPEVLATALIRTASEIESKKWHGRFFARVLQGVIEDELSPSPADQAKARSQHTPAGKITAEQEAERDRKKREAARRAQERERQDREAEEAEAAEAKAREAYEWLGEQPEEVQAKIKADAESGIRKLGIPNPPAPMVRAYLAEAVEQTRHRAGAPSRGHR